MVSLFLYSCISLAQFAWVPSGKWNPSYKNKAKCESVENLTCIDVTECSKQNVESVWNKCDLVNGRAVVNADKKTAVESRMSKSTSDRLEYIQKREAAIQRMIDQLGP